MKEKVNRPYEHIAVRQETKVKFDNANDCKSQDEFLNVLLMEYSKRQA